MSKNAMTCKSCESREVTRYLRNDKSRYDYYCPCCGSRKKPHINDSELVVENVRAKKERQREMDKNRIANKSFREHARVENAIEALGEALNEHISTIANTLSTGAIKMASGVPSKEVGLIQLTDLHLNELIDMPHNKFDIEVASARLRKLVSESISIFETRGITSVVCALTGDLLNSDRRLDELLSQSTNRAKACIVGAELITRVIMDIAENFEQVTVLSVVGNEGRADKEMAWSDEGLSNNYDFMIPSIAKRIIERSDMYYNITWLPFDKVEQVVNINGQNVLFTHDIQKATKSQKDGQSTVGRYALTGVQIDAIFGGHLHSTNIGNFTYRASSLAGSNAFNERALNLVGRASQNIAVFGNGYRHVFAIDLQETSGAMYEISSDLMEYNAKSVDKTKSGSVVFKVVI